MKTKTTFFCQNCGTQFPKWVGRCTSCGEWNTVVEEIVQKEEKRNWKQTSTVKKVAKALKIHEITASRKTGSIPTTESSTGCSEEVWLRAL